MIIRTGVVILALIILIVASGVAWQHGRYLYKRRAVVRDRQPLLYGSATFHVVTLLELEPQGDLFADTGALLRRLEDEGGGRVVYAGKRALHGAVSSQIPERDWDVVLLTQYASRDQYGAYAGSGACKDAHATFASSYSIGMDRPALLNLALPAMLLGLRVRDILYSRPPRYPFEPADEEMWRASGRPEARPRVNELRREHELGRNAVVVVNFIRHGDAKQRAADSGYTAEMAGLMAEQGHGPMHIGPAVTLEGGAQFDRVALVFYPGVEYMADMIESRFFGGIIGGKQLGDTQAIITVPLLGRI